MWNLKISANSYSSIVGKLTYLPVHKPSPTYQVPHLMAHPDSMFPFPQV